MKKKVILITALFAALVTGCRKENEDVLPAQTSPAENLARPGNANECRMVFAGRDNSYGYFFRYNEQGFVSEWKVDFYDGYPDYYTFQYDHSKRLKSGHVLYSVSGHEYDIKYQYQGSRLVRETWYKTGTTDIADDIVNTYNWRGQIAKRKSMTYNIYADFAYNWQGNNVKTDLYVDNNLYLREEFTFNRPNRNPFTSLTGMPLVPFYYDFIFSNWWQTSEKYTLFDNGTPTVVMDLDPNSVVMNIGQQHYLNSVTNFDLIGQQNTSAVFQFENCPGCNTTKPGFNSETTHSRANVSARIRQLLTPCRSSNLKSELKKIIEKAK